MILLNSPHNPTGSVFTLEELQTIAAVAIDNDLIVISDEVYEHLIFDNKKHIPIATLPGMFERTITCSSLSKTYSITGWRLGTVVAPANLIDVIRKVHDFLTVGAAAPLQAAAVTALEFPDSYYASLQATYTAKRDIFLNALDQAGLSYSRPQGAYYVMVDVSDFGVTDDVEFCEWMARYVGVAGVPGSSFFREPVRHLVRFHFAKREETLRAAAEKLLTLPAKAKGR